MAEERVQRKLTTILAADVEGYSRLMSADEETTLNRSGGHGTRLFPTRPGVLDLVVEFASEAVVR